MAERIASGAAVVLSGSIGSGHDAVAEACALALASFGVRSESLDCMALLGGPGQRVGEYVFRRALRVAPVFDAFHFSALRAGSALADRIDASSARRLVPALAARLGGMEPGLLLSVFATGAGAAGRLRSELVGWRTAVFCTDAAAHRLWVQPGIERYLVCSTAAAGTVRQYDPAADVVVLPPPVRSVFFGRPGRAAARARLGLDPSAPHVLLMAGGWGLGPLAEAATALADAGYHVLAVAGRNRRLEARLVAAADARPARAAGRIVPMGFTAQVPDLMAAADVVVTTSGQTCHEARVVGRPLVILDIVPGHGRENLLLELAAGGAVGCSPVPERVVEAVTATLRRDEPVCPWPVGSAEDWQKLFADAVSDLV